MTGPLVEVTREDRLSGVARVESVHEGTIVVVGPDGEVAAAHGDPESPVFLRSAVKPFQASACLEILEGSGVAPDSAEIAVACASHRAEPRHLDVVERLLDRSSTSALALTCPPASGLHDPGAAPVRLRHNCSGKHAMFALAGGQVGASREQLLDPDGPLQERVLGVLAEALGPPEAVAIDGCGAPAVATPLRRLAEAFSGLATEPRWGPAREAMLAHPFLVGGEGRAECALLEQGILAKPGAEGVFGASFVDVEGGGWGVAVKIADGASRASATATVGLLERWDVLASGTWAAPAPTGGGEPVGQIRVSDVVDELAASLPAVRRG